MSCGEGVRAFRSIGESVNIRTASKAARDLLIGMPCLWILCSSAQAQQRPPAEPSAQFLPSSLGEPFTVVPIDMPDVECQVLEWNEKLNSPIGPTLTLLCPPEQVFAPLRVLIKLSWLDQDKKGAPVDPEKILVMPGEKTRLRTRKDSAFVLLDVVGADGRRHKRWIPFTGVADVALLPRLRKALAQKDQPGGLKSFRPSR